jgi:hypothetical protein
VDPLTVVGNLYPLKDTRLSLVSGSVKFSRFYSAGPTDFIDRLTKVDARIAEFESRASSGDVGKCVSEEPKLWDLKDIRVSRILPGVDV